MRTDAPVTNLWGIINGAQVFAPGMIARQRLGLIINTGSKQGITTPPGNPRLQRLEGGRQSFYRGAAARANARTKVQDHAAQKLPLGGFIGLCSAYSLPLPLSDPPPNFRLAF